MKGQYEVYGRVDLPMADESSATQDPSSYTIEAEPFSLKDRVIHESKMYLEIVEELG